MGKIVVIRPGEEATIEEVDGRFKLGNEVLDLKTMQKVVDGLIEIKSIDRENRYLLVSNEEGKLNDFEPNFYLMDDEENPVDLYFGTCFICKEFGEEIGCLTELEAKSIQASCARLKRAKGDEKSDDWLHISILPYDWFN